MRNYLVLLISLSILFLSSQPASAMPISWDVGAAGAPAYGDADSKTGTFNQAEFYSQTTTVQYDTDGNTILSVGDQFSDSGDLRIRTLLAPVIIDYEGLNQFGGYEATARWTNVQGRVTGVTLDPVTGDTRIDVRYTAGTVNIYLDPALDSLFANPLGTSPPTGAGGGGFGNGTLIATLNLKEGIGHTFIDFAGGDLSNQGSVDLLLEFTYALPGFWYDSTRTVALDPVASGMTALLDMNIDTPTQVPGAVPGTLFTAYSNEDGSILFQGSPCVNLEKEVSVDGLPLVVPGPDGTTIWNPAKTWFDADLWEDSPTTGMAATYRLIVENCGAVELTNVTLNDIAPTTTIPEKIVFENVNIGNLLPGQRKMIVAGWIGGTTGALTAIEGFSGLDAPTRCQDSWVSVDGSPEGMYLNTAEVTTDQLVRDNDPAWVNCRMEEPGACRMTGGSVTVNNFIDVEGDARVFYNYIDGTYSADKNTVTTGKGKSATTVTTWVTTGGQIGAPSTNPATGHWEHSQHAGAEGLFTFLAGTASAPPGTEISHIACADPGWCVQARCAPFKQIFWDGIGYFPNKHGGEDFNASFPSSTCTVTPGGPSRDGTLHYFRAMVGDFGENDRRNRQISADNCEWLTTTGGPSGYDVSEVVELDATPNAQFGDKGGEDCDKCPDYYQIEIYCGSSKETKGEVIYTFADFIDGGNFQIHPETSEQCTSDLFVPTSPSSRGGRK